MGDPLRDVDRLLALRASGLGRGTHQAAFEPLLALATRLLGGPVGLVSVVDAPVDDRLAGHPAITDLGVIAYCGVPIRDAGGHVLGSFCAIDTTEHAWSGDDVEVLRTLAEAVAATVSVELRHGTLIRSLQRRVVPVPGAAEASAGDLHAAYRPAMRAAVAMAELQASARTAGSQGGSLLEVIQTLDAAAPHIHGVSYAAMVAPRFAPDGRRFEHLSCGAIPALVVAHDGSARFCTEAQTPPLAFPGAVRHVHRHEERVAGVVFVTDGLVERRGEDIDEGMDRLAALAPEVMADPDPAGSLADQLGAGSEDDVAVVVVRPER